jgi:hypothetical protein
MPLKYQWTRTVIAGEPQPYDYCCHDGERAVGRVYKHVNGPQTGSWFWAMNAFGPSINRRDCQRSRRPMNFLERLRR